MTDSNAYLTTLKRWLHERVRRRLPRLLCHRMIEGPRFKVEYWSGDEAWRASLHFNFKWLGTHRWIVIFL